MDLHTVEMVLAASEFREKEMNVMNSKEVAEVMQDRIDKTSTVLETLGEAQLAMNKIIGLSNITECEEVKEPTSQAAELIEQLHYFSVSIDILLRQIYRIEHEF